VAERIQARLPYSRVWWATRLNVNPCIARPRVDDPEHAVSPRAETPAWTAIRVSGSVSFRVLFGAFPCAPVPR
jgi:hypothetical protein